MSDARTASDLNVSELHQNGRGLVRQIAELLVNLWESQNDPAAKIIDYKPPKTLLETLDLALEEEAAQPDRVRELCQQIMDLSLHSGHPAFFNQLWGGLDSYGLIGAWMTEVLHTSVYTFEVAPVFTLMEQYVIRYVGKELVGYENEEPIDGLFNPGGSISNILGLHLARYKLNPMAKTDGNAAFDKPLVILTSEESHYSLRKGASLLGLGTSSVWKVATDRFGRMKPEDLRERILQAKAENKLPFIVCATSGTTVLGAYDPLDEIADICEEFAIWMHVDAAWGGPAMLSPHLRHLVKGINRADSVIWNPHKMLGIPLQCAMFLTRHKGLLLECNSNKSTYLFQTDKFYDSEYDIGDRTFLCGRKNDVLKFWLTWKARGRNGLTSAVENAFAMSRYFAELIRNREGFHLVLPEVQCTNVCFWYVPPSLRAAVDWDSELFREKVGKVAPRLKKRMIEKGGLFIGYQPLEHRHLPNFFRLVIHCNPPPTEKSMRFVMEEIERLGNDIEIV